MTKPVCVAHLLRSGTPDTPLHTLDSPVKTQSASLKSLLLVRRRCSVAQLHLKSLFSFAKRLLQPTYLCSQVVTRGQVLKPEQAVPVACPPSTRIMLHNLMSEHTPLTSCISSYSLCNSCGGFNSLTWREANGNTYWPKNDVCLLLAHSQLRHLNEFYATYSTYHI